MWICLCDFLKMLYFVYYIMVFFLMKLKVVGDLFYNYKVLKYFILRFYIDKMYIKYLYFICNLV